MISFQLHVWNNHHITTCASVGRQFSMGISNFCHGCLKHSLQMFFEQKHQVFVQDYLFCAYLYRASILANSWVLCDLSTSHLLGMKCSRWFSHWQSADSTGSLEHLGQATHSVSLWPLHESSCSLFAHGFLHSIVVSE